MDGASATMEPMSEEPNQTGAPMEADGAAEASPALHTDLDDALEILPHRVVEAILFASDSTLPAAKIASILGVGDARDVRKHVAALNAEYADRQAAFRIEEIAGGFQMMTLPAYNTWLTKLLRTRQESKLSQAAMETLAIVAYKQPCTRADIEAIRGVAAGDMLNRLREANLVKIVGRAEDLGRPLLYGTTRHFLEIFGLAALEDLPQVEALSSGATAGKTAPPRPTTGSPAPSQDAGQDDGEPIDEKAPSEDEAAPSEDEAAAGPRLSLVDHAAADDETAPGEIDDDDS